MRRNVHPTPTPTPILHKSVPLELPIAPQLQPPPEVLQCLRAPNSKRGHRRQRRIVARREAEVCLFGVQVTSWCCVADRCQSARRRHLDRFRRANMTAHGGSDLVDHVVAMCSFVRALRCSVARGKVSMSAATRLGRARWLCSRNAESRHAGWPLRNAATSSQIEVGAETLAWTKVLEVCEGAIVCGRDPCAAVLLYWHLRDTGRKLV